MGKTDIKRIIEALIFASDFPLSLEKIGEILGDISQNDLVELVEEIQAEYEQMERGFVLDKVAGGYEFVTKSELSGFVNKLLAGRRKNRMSRAGLETIAIIAYHQPITRGDVEKTRGVDCGGPIRTLLERKLIGIAGREKVPGRPLIYITTDEFLRYFGIVDLNDLPKMEEIEEILKNDRDKESVKIEQLSIKSGNSGQEKMQPSD